MLFRDGAIVGQLSGRLGPAVASHNRYGSYFRAGTIPVTSTTEYAIAAKARLTAASQAWQGLTEPQRAAWIHYGQQNPIVNRIGEAKEPTGHAAFVGIYSRMHLDSLTPLTEPPIDPPSAPLTSIELVADIGLGGVNLTFAPTPTEADEKIWLLACKTNSHGIKFVENYKRFVATSELAEESPWDIQAVIEARIGALVVDQVLTVFAAIFDTVTGQLSGFLRASAIVEETAA